MTGLDDRHHPEHAIDITGIRIKGLLSRISVFTDIPWKELFDCVYYF